VTGSDWVVVSRVRVRSLIDRKRLVYDTYHGTADLGRPSHRERRGP